VRKKDHQATQHAMVTYEDIEAAHSRIDAYVEWTPVFVSESLNRLVGAELFFKCENLQKTGSFKFRGATNAIRCMDEETLAKGVATHSSGNHAAALARAAREAGTRCFLVMPTNAPKTKLAAAQYYGGEVYHCKPTLEAREKALQEVLAKTGAVYVAPYNNEDVIAGQGTCGLEMMNQNPALDMVLTPIGGGGLTGGVSVAVKELSPETRIIAVEPAGADDAFRSFKAGKIIPSENPTTIADGLLTSLGEKTFPLIQQHVNDIVTVNDDAIVEAMGLIFQRLKLVVEPSAAVPLAAVLADKVDVDQCRVGIILSGGNTDLDKLPW
jgi:threonine dehydratase